ncbi:MAG: SMP-30/gluconolactonase/LRE family protein [Mycobacterium sp.]|nr:SMP-30/gluconolactonase/LRE family protein [Mycobacterium sp.]
MTLVPLANGFCFGEGPRWFEGLVWFSDMLGEAVHTVTLGGEMSTLELAGHSPSGLGFRQDGTLLIVSTQHRQLLGYDGETVTTVADLSDLVPADLGDMVVDRHGCAYLGSQARKGGVIVRVDPDRDGAECATVVAGDLDFPNGMAITPDGATLIVAESTGRRLTAFTIAADGSLSDRRVFADGLDGPPGGICLDDGGGVWAAMTLAHQFERIIESGGSGACTVTDRIDMGDRTAIACALGGPEGRTLFLLSSTDAYPQRLVGTKLSRLDATTVDVPAAVLR